MCASTHQKKRKSASPTTTSNSQQQELWHRHFGNLDPQVKQTIECETRAARAAGGSRLAVAMSLLTVRRILCGDATNPKQKQLWSAYLAVNLPGFYISRSQVFTDIKAAKVARETFPAAFLDEFLASGYALNVRPTVEEPIGKYTKPCQQILAKLKHEELSGKECQTVLAEAAAFIKADAKRSRLARPTLSIQEKRQAIYAEIHNAVISGIEQLSNATEPGYSYSADDVRCDLELILGRIMTAVPLDALDVETRNLPDGLNRLGDGNYRDRRAETDRRDGATLPTCRAGTRN